jgi:hypothetical protein
VFAYSFVTFKHLFFDFTEVAFYDVQNADSEFSGPFAYLKHNFRDFVQVAFLDAQVAENVFQLPFVTFKHRFIDHQSTILRRPEGNL